MAQKAQIVIPEYGRHNADLQKTGERISKAQTYRDLSTIIICPTRGTIHAKVVQSWMGLIRPMNQRVIGPLFAIGLEVGDAYNQMIMGIMNNVELAKYKYILTIEEDNIPPPDGLMKLYENIDKFDVVGGLYFTKGEDGMPMIYGNPREIPKNFIPQIPTPNTIQECNGMGMGFHLFKMDIFRKMPMPWFRTLQEFTPGVGLRVYTQDLFFFENAAKFGYRFACDNRVLVGHYDINSDIVW